MKIVVTSVLVDDQPDQHPAAGLLQDDAATSAPGRGTRAARSHARPRAARGPRAALPLRLNRRGGRRAVAEGGRSAVCLSL